MALKPVFFLLLWDLTMFVHGAASVCDVTCWTDYEALLNCSCSGSDPTRPVTIQVTCRDEELVVTDSCEVEPLQSWCVMYPELLDDVASIGTTCVAEVMHQGGRVLTNATWALSDVVKPRPPVKVQVTNADGFYNVTWDDSQGRCLTYGVRVRESKDLSKDPLHSTLKTEEKYVLLDSKKLQPSVNYTVDVQAQMCPGYLYTGPWSEWSSTAEWGTRGTSADAAGMKRWWWFFSVPVVLLLVLLLGYSQKPWWQKKLQRIVYIPRPHDFFKPLDLSYGGNFKEWVKPVFSEYDYLRINPHAPIMSENDVLRWNNEKQSYSKDSETKEGGHFLHMLRPHSNSLLFFGDGSQGTGHSTGHVSIHTVTLSGEEEFDEEVASQSSAHTLRSYREGESFASFQEDNREHAGYDLEEPQRHSGMLPQLENQISDDSSGGNINFQPHARLHEPERVSLDSFASNEQSEDGYPHVDLDTIDSGFGECGSPRASDSNIAEQMDSDLFHENKGSNSNYVKQWMICRTIQEDSSNSENELTHEAQ